MKTFIILIVATFIPIFAAESKARIATFPITLAFSDYSEPSEFYFLYLRIIESHNKNIKGAQEKKDGLLANGQSINSDVAKLESVPEKDTAKIKSLRDSAEKAFSAAQSLEKDIKIAVNMQLRIDLMEFIDGKYLIVVDKNSKILTGNADVIDIEPEFEKWLYLKYKFNVNSISF